jgi:hypothetical protein
MAEETVRIGCRLPSGIKLEVGMVVTIPDANHPGYVIVKNQRTPQYRSVVIKGTHEHTAGVRRQGIQMPAMLNAEPYFTEVPKALWDEWVKTDAPGLVADLKRQSVYCPEGCQRRQSGQH